jgi:hypothetical protein
MGLRPICMLIPTGLPTLSSIKFNCGSRVSTGTPSTISNLVTMLLPITCSGGIPRPNVESILPLLDEDWKLSLVTGRKHWRRRHLWQPVIPVKSGFGNFPQREESGGAIYSFRKFGLMFR